MLVVAVPLAAVLVYNWWRALEESRALAVSELSANAAQIVRDLANLRRQSEWILTHMAQRPAIRAMRASACEDELSLLTDAHPAFYLVTLWKADGTLVCSSIPPDPGKPLPRPHQPTFEISISTPGLYLSNVFVGPVTGVPIATFTFPVRDGGNVIGLLSLPVRIEYFATFLESIEIKPGGAAAVLDREGTIAARRPDNAAWRGKSALDVPGVRDELLRSTGVSERDGVDGVKRILVHQEVPGLGWHAFVGLRADVLFADSRSLLVRGIAVFLVVIALSLVSAYLISRGISRPLRELVAVANAVAKGDRSARARFSGEGEFDQLAGNLNHMLDALGQSDSSLRGLADRLRTTLESITDAFFTLDHEWRFTYLNSEAERQLRRPRTELLGKVIWEEFKEAVGTPADHEYRSAMRSMQSVDFEQFYEPLGKWFEVRAYPSTEGLAVYFRDVSERKRVEGMLRQSMTRARELSSRLLLAEEAERKRIAQDLHDQLGQDLTALKIRLDTLARTLEPPQARAQVLEAAAASGETLQRVRQMSMDLRPPQLDSLGLVAALRAHVERLAALGTVALHFDSRGFAATLPADLAIVCFRVVQEALTNVMRHAGAANAWIELRSSGEGVRITVRDDGAGFDAAQALERGAAGGGVGLPGMQERVALVGGTLDIRSGPGQGCTVTATFPLPGSGTRA